ncbi:MAG: YdeI/OmpD-associated family protein [Gemmatimonadales bacterium]
MEVRTDRLRFFRSPSALGRWLESNHAKADELWVGFHSKASGKGGITYSEALDEALRFGWIDGIRKKLDEQSSAIRFTPRRQRSNWSNINIARVNALTSAGRMAPPGVAAFQARDPAKSGVYSFEQGKTNFDSALKKRFMAEPEAWRFFMDQPPYYRRIATWWVISAKRQDTRDRRLVTLIEHSAHGRRLPQVTPTKKK